MNRKRAESNVDWIIAFSLFFFYIVWFFIFVKPIFFADQNPDFLTNVKNGFLADTTWKVYRYPVQVVSTFTENHAPLFATYDLGLNSSFLFLHNHSFLLDTGRIFFIGDVSNGKNYFFLMASNETYTPAYEASDLYASSTTLSAMGMRSSFQNGLLTNAEYRGKVLLNKLQTTFNGETLQNTSTFVRSTTVARIGVTRDELTVNNYGFAFNPIIYTFIQPNSKTHTVQLTADLTKFGSFLTDPATSKSLAYPANCETYESNMASFFDNDTIAFLFDRRVNMSVCPKNTSLQVTFSYAIQNESLYKIVFFNGSTKNYSLFTTQPNAIIKTGEPIFGISFINLLNLKSYSYDALKQRWGADNFEIIGKNTTVTFIDIGTNPPEGINIIAQERNYFLVDKYGFVSNFTLVLRGWK